MYVVSGFSRTSSRSRAAIAPKSEQRMIGGLDALHSLEKQPGGKKSEGHPVATVPEREQMARIALMGADVRETIWRHREYAFPRVVDAYVSQRRKELLEIILVEQISTPEKDGYTLRSAKTDSPVYQRVFIDIKIF